jgi:Raf kinase inhibitor-like YbhB/YbcL family protein
VPLLLTTPAFPPGGEIPREYTCDGSNISPPLSWSGIPAGAASLVLVIEDPDAPRSTFRHWGVYDIPPSAPGIPAGAAVGRVARNDFGQYGYGGPCPPAGGGVHHYHFELMALNRPTLGLPPSAGIADVLRAAAPYVISRIEVVGTYRR